MRDSGKVEGFGGPKMVPRVLAVAINLIGPASAEDATFTTRNLTMETALKASQAAMHKCRDEGFQVSVAVVDRGGAAQVILRDRFASPGSPDIAKGKATTAASFKMPTPGAPGPANDERCARAGIEAIAEALEP